jgi:hypothetical protein
MYQIDQATAVSELPTPLPAATQGFFTNGNPASGEAATILDADFANMLMMELINVVEAGGLTPSKTTYNQVVTAIQTLMQQNGANYAHDTSATANQIVVALAPAPTAYAEPLTIRFKAANTNVSTTNGGACTININGIGAISLQSGAGALQGGEIVAGKQYSAIYNASLNAAVLIGQAGGAVPVALATQSEHAVQLGQVAAFGAVRNLTASLTAAATSITFAAQAIVVKSALAGISTLLTNYSETLNLATTGAGGMDTGSAPDSGFVGVYAIWGAAGTSIIATNGTAASVPEQYGGANMPAGYTQSQLISVLPINSSGQIKALFQRDRTVSIANVSALNSSTSQSSLTALSISAVVPPSATEIGGTLNAFSTTSSTLTLVLSSNASGFDLKQASTTAADQVVTPFSGVKLISQQSMYYSATSSAGTPTYIITIGQYSF